MNRPRVLLVTGAFYPEISSAGVQARAAARALAGRVEFAVVTTAVDPALPSRETIDGVPVHRLPVDVTRWSSRVAASVNLAWTFAKLRRTIDLVHVHGFSRKNLAIAVLARFFRKPLVLTLHTAGQDDPAAVQARGPIATWAYRGADLFLSVSPQLTEKFRASGLPTRKLEEVPNGVDTARFRPSSDAERLALRRELGLPSNASIVLFVGFFSRDKRPDMLCEAWLRLVARVGQPVALVCVGATVSPYFEVDPRLAEDMRTAARRAGIDERLVFVEPTNAIEKYFRAADVFALPSAREAMPMALIEAMACGLPSVATRLAGATDAIIDDGVNGWLVDDVDDLAVALESMLFDRGRAAAIGRCARQSVLERFNIERMAERWLAAYERVLTAA